MKFTYELNGIGWSEVFVEINEKNYFVVQVIYRML